MSTDPMEAYWDREDERIDELGKIAQEAGLVLPADSDSEDSDSDVNDSKDKPPTEAADDAAVKALTEPKTKKFD